MSESPDERIHELIDRAFQVEDPQMEDPQMEEPQTSGADDPESREWLELAGLLAYQLEPTAVDEEHKSRLFDRLGLAPGAAFRRDASPTIPFRPASQETDPSSSLHRARWAVAAAILLSVALAGLSGLLYGRLQSQSVRLAEVAELRSHLALISAPETALCRLSAQHAEQPTAFGTVFMNMGVKRWVMTAENLRPAPRGKLYQVWFMVDGQTVPAGSFRVDERSRIEIGSDNLPANVSAILITMEPAERPSAPSGPTVLYGDERAML